MGGQYFEIPERLPWWKWLQADEVDWSGNQPTRQNFSFKLNQLTYNKQDIDRNRNTIKIDFEQDGKENVLEKLPLYTKYFWIWNLSSSRENIQLLLNEK